MKADWTKISENPVAPDVHQFLLKGLAGKKAGRVFDFMSFLRSFVEGKSVLDIGVVEHDVSHIESDRWKHRQIKQWASSALGVDIQRKGVELLKERGFDVLHLDATSDTDIGRRFERIVIGDVIEHVDNPVRLLQFARRHLADGGCIFVSTPNPYWLGFIARVLREGTLIANAEHISWVTPSMAIEIGRRAGLDIEEYWLLQSHGGKWWTKALHRGRDLFFADSELFSVAFFYIYTHRQ